MTGIADIPHMRFRAPDPEAQQRFPDGFGLLPARGNESFGVRKAPVEQLLGSHWGPAADGPP